MCRLSSKLLHPIFVNCVSQWRTVFFRFLLCAIKGSAFCAAGSITVTSFSYRVIISLLFKTSVRVFPVNSLLLFSFMQLSLFLFSNTDGWMIWTQSYKLNKLRRECTLFS